MLAFRCRFSRRLHGFAAPASRARSSPTAGGFAGGGFGQREVRLDLVAVAAAVLLRPVRAAARTRSRCLAQGRHPQDSGIL